MTTARPISTLRPWHPTPAQAMLIAIALARDTQMAESLWEEWNAKYHVVDVSGESYVLLASAVANLLQHKVSLSPKLVGASRNTALRNLVIEGGVRDAMRVLTAREVAVYPLKGVALYAAGVYQRKDERVMYDIDLYVPRRQHAQALKILAASGWQVHADVEGSHAVGVTRPGLFCKIDVHRRPWWFQMSAADIDYFECGLHDHGGLTAEFLLLHILVHGARGGSNDFSTVAEPHLRWMIDVGKLIEHEQNFNWHDFVAHAKQLEVGLPVREALVYLKERFALSVPAAALEALAKIPKTRTQKLRAYYCMNYVPPKIFIIPRLLRHSFRVWLLQRYEPTYINALTWRGYLRELNRFVRKEYEVDEDISLIRFVIKRIIAKPRLLLP